MQIEKHFGKKRGKRILSEITRGFSFSKIRRKRTVSKNLVYVCTRGTERFVLKKYVPRKGLEREFKKRALNEISTYLALQDGLGLPKVLAYDASKLYLITRFEPLRKVDALSEKTARDAAALLLKIHGMKPPAHPHLFKYGYSYYHNTLHHMLRNLEKQKTLSKSECEKTDEIFESRREDIDRALGTFVHGDFHLENLFYLENNLVPMDFEYGGTGSPAYDLAVFCFSAGKSPHKETFLKKYLARRKIRNFKRLFKLMILRRCIELLHAFADKPKSPQYTQARAELRELIR